MAEKSCLQNVPTCTSKSKLYVMLLAGCSISTNQQNVVYEPVVVVDDLSLELGIDGESGICDIATDQRTITWNIRGGYSLPSDFKNKNEKKGSFFDPAQFPELSWFASHHNSK